MAEFIGDIMYPNGVYIKEGEEKTSWLKCGAVFRSDSGQLSLKMEAVPTVWESGQWFRVFDKREQDKPSGGGYRKPAPAQPAPKQDDAFQDDDDIPF